MYVLGVALPPPTNLPLVFSLFDMFGMQKRSVENVVRPKIKFLRYIGIEKKKKSQKKEKASRREKTKVGYSKKLEGWAQPDVWRPPPPPRLQP